MNDANFIFCWNQRIANRNWEHQRVRATSVGHFLCSGSDILVKSVDDAIYTNADWSLGLLFLIATVRENEQQDDDMSFWSSPSDKS